MTALPPAWYRIKPERRKAARIWLRDLMRKKPESGRFPRGSGPSVRNIREAVGCQQAEAALIKRLWSGGSLPDLETGRWDLGPTGAEFVPQKGGGRPRKAKPEAPPEIEELKAKLKGVTDPKELQGLRLRIADLAISGVLSRWQTETAERQVDKLEARLDEARANDPESPTAVVLVTEDGDALLRAFEGMVCDGRRARVLSFVQREAESDALEHPNVDRSRTAAPAEDAA